jgi:hypothetical protein
MLEKEALVEQLRDKLATKRFEMDEMLVGRDGQAREWAKEMEEQAGRIEELERELGTVKRERMEWSAERQDVSCAEGLS